MSVQQVFPWRRGVALPDLKVASTTVFNTTTSSYSSTSYVDLLRNGTTTISVTYDKLQSGTGMWVRGGFSGRAPTSGRIVLLGVNDGTTDYDLAAARFFRIGISKWAAGERILTGIGTGSKTYKLRIKLESGGVNIDFADSCSAYITVAEVP